MTDNKITAAHTFKVLTLSTLAASGAAVLRQSVEPRDTLVSTGRSLKQIVLTPTPPGVNPPPAPVASPPPPPVVAAPPPPVASPPPPPVVTAPPPPVFSAPRVVFPITVNGTRLQYASGDTARLFGVNVSPNDAGGVAPRDTSTTEQAWRAAVAEGANFLVANIYEDLSMAQNGTKLSFVSDLSNFARTNLPEVLLAWGPLTNDATDSRGAPTDATCQILSTVAADLVGNPNVAIMVGNQFARSKADYYNNVGNHEINTQLMAQVNNAYNAIRAVNPSVLVLTPSLIDETSGAQYSRSLQAWVGNTENFTNTAFTSSLWTTGATDAEQQQQVQSWVGQYSGQLPVVVTQMAPGQSTASDTNMSQAVFADTMNQLATNNTPVALWNWEYQIQPSAQNAPINSSTQLNLTSWGTQMVQTIRNASAGMPVLPQN